MLPNIGWGEALLILAVVLLLFGAKRLPELSKSLGESFRIFKESLKSGSSDKKP